MEPEVQSCVRQTTETKSLSSSSRSSKDCLLQNEAECFGLPLDNHETYTKLDWIVWTATLADAPEDFNAFIDPLYRFANETPTRVPLTDWYWTQDGSRRGFKARSVVGGIYIKMLTDQAMWKKWISRASARFNYSVAAR